MPWPLANIIGGHAMDYRDAIAAIKGRHYYAAAGFMLDEMLRDKIHSLTQEQTDEQVNSIGKTLKQNHKRIHDMYKGTDKPNEIAEQAYNETFFRLAPKEAYETLGIDEFL